VPVWRPQAHESRNKVDSPVVFESPGHNLSVFRGVDDAELIAKPLHDRAGDEYAALERVDSGLSIHLPGHGCEKVVPGSNKVGPGIEQHETTGAVRILVHARPGARLSKQRRLLVAGVAGNYD